MTKSRAMTAEECREEMFKTMAALGTYWATVEGPFIKPGQTEIESRIQGFLFSLLVMFDGGNMSVPGFNITPAPHPDDKAYCKSIGENWWPAKVVINDVSMHDVFPWEKFQS